MLITHKDQFLKQFFLYAVPFRYYAFQRTGENSRYKVSRPLTDADLSRTLLDIFLLKSRTVTKQE